MLDCVKETMTAESIPDYSPNIRHQFFFFFYSYTLLTLDTKAMLGTCSLAVFI